MRAGKAIWWVLLIVVGVVLIIGFVSSRMGRFHGREAWRASQRASFHSMDAALELFNNAFEGYPPSDPTDSTGLPYCGAMKLCEALMGRDLLGFHSASVFRADGKDASGRDLYDPCDLSARKGPYLSPESADAVTLLEMYGKGNTGAFPEDVVVLCDVYAWRRKGGAKAGMPILYYKADTSKAAHDVKDPNNPDNIYSYRDNHALLSLGVPGRQEKRHPLFENPALFYKMTRDKKVKDKSAPCNADSFILISAGWDGLYGTRDDVTNFGD